MKDNSKFEDMISRDLDVRAGDRTYNRMRRIVLDAHESSKKKTSAARLTIARRMTMKSPIVKLTVAAAVIIAVVLGLFELIGTESKSGVVWAEVAQKVQASGGLILRITETGSVSLDDSDYAIKYFSPVGSRTDAYKDGQVTHSRCSNYETMTATYIYHAHKNYISTQLWESSEGFLEKDEDWTNPKYLVQQILSVEHKELGKKTVDGVLCEGLETSDPAVMGAALMELVDRIEVHMELWVDVQTQYPVRFESTVTAEAEGEHIESDCVMDQFQWDVEIDPNLFTLEMPAGYIDITPDER
ncbi:MAG: hypothetical protein AMJ75_03130 [Phycisphaerae bacterium SM1_79]|nr:MAG: hypothetical protein AMJ75_03130 [Phycisphaerae bacterium SM1_79]